MLFRRNKTYEKTPPSAAKKSLLERLVILDADGMDSPETVAEKLEEDPTVEAKVVRVRSFAPEQSMPEVPADKIIDESEFEMPRGRKEGISDMPRPLHVERFEDAVSEINEEESEKDSEEQDGVESVNISIDSMPEEVFVQKTFDILERAKEQEVHAENDGEQVRIIYRVPKGAYNNASTRNAIHNELIDRINSSIGGLSDESVPETTQSIEIPSMDMKESDDALQREETAENPDLIEEIRAVAGSGVTNEHAREIIESALADAVNSGELDRSELHEGIENTVEGPQWISGVEDVYDMPKANHFEKVLFPEQYFYANDGTVIKTAAQLKDALLCMSHDTFNHHAVSRGTNDFANWIEGVYGHADAARRLKVAGSRDEMATVLELYLQ